MKVFIDPVYYYNMRGTGVITRHYFALFDSDDNYQASLILGETTAKYILRIPLAYVVWEQVILPFILFVTRPEIYLASGGTMPWITPKSTKTVLICHDLICFESFPRTKISVNIRQKLGSFYRRCIFNFYDNASLIVCISQTTRDKLLELKPYLNGKTLVIYNQCFRFDECTPDYKNNGEILFISGSSPSKNALALENVLQSLQDSSADSIWVLGPVLAQCNYDLQIRSVSGITDEELLKLYMSAKIIVIPSLSEGFCLPLIEGLLSGCEVISNDVEILREIGGDWCWYADFTKVAEIEKCFEEIENGSYKNTPLVLDTLRNKYGNFDNYKKLFDAMERL